MKLLKPVLGLFLLFFWLFQGSAVAGEMITLTDMRGRSVTFPKNPARVATVDDGLVEGVMTHLGVIDKIVAVSSRSLKEHFHFGFETATGENFGYSGFNTI